LKLRSESGNALIEFIVVGLVAQLIIFGVLLNFGSAFRSQIAAEAIGRQVLRNFQLHGSVAAGQEIAAQAISLFGLPPNSTKVAVQEDCGASGTVSVSVTVREKNYLTSGFCFG
jgi:hypothetical protein